MFGLTIDYCTRRRATPWGVASPLTPPSAGTERRSSRPPPRQGQPEACKKRAASRERPQNATGQEAGRMGTAAPGPRDEHDRHRVQHRRTVTAAATGPLPLRSAGQQPAHEAHRDPALLGTEGGGGSQNLPPGARG